MESHQVLTLKAKTILNKKNKTPPGSRNHNFLAWILSGLFFANTPIYSAWNTFRGNSERTGTYTNALGLAPTRNDLSWQIKLGGGIASSPAVSNGTLYVGSRDSTVYAIDIETGQIQWRVKTGGPVESSPSIIGENLLIGSVDGYLYTIETQTGKVISKANTGFQISTPLILDNRLLINSSGPPVNSINLYRLKKNILASEDLHFQKSLEKMSYSSPAVLGNMLTVGANDGKLYGFEIADDTLVPKWEYQTRGGVYLSTPTMEDSIVYFAPGNEDPYVYAIKISTGELLWKTTVSLGGTGLSKISPTSTFQIPEFQQLNKASPAYRQKIFNQYIKQGKKLNGISVSAKSGSLSKSGASSGNWTPISETKTSSITLGKKNAYVVQKQLGFLIGAGQSVTSTPRFTFAVLDKKSGSPVWTFQSVLSAEKSSFSSSPIVAPAIDGGEIIFFGWGEGQIYGVHAKSDGSHQVVWDKRVKGDVVSSPVVTGEKLYISTLEGNLYAYKLQEMENPQTFQDSSYFYPNPVRDDRQEANFRFQSSVFLNVELTIYNTAERPVDVLKFDISANTTKNQVWSLKGLANGAYMAKAVAKNPGTGQELVKWFKIALLRK